MTPIERLRAEAKAFKRELRLCQHDLLAIRREGPRATRPSSARCTLQLCNLNRHYYRCAQARLRQHPQREAA